MRRIELPWRDRAIVIADVDDPAAWFSGPELELVSAFHLPKRREEWMLSRIAAKQLALERGICDGPQKCRVEQRRIGSWFVSLSHSGRFAAAAIAERPTGIDVQVVRELKETAAHLFLSSEEEAAMNRCVLPHRLLHFWCAKEAAWKQRGGEIPTLKQIPLLLLREDSAGLVFAGVETVAVDEIIVALTV